MKAHWITIPLMLGIAVLVWVSTTCAGGKVCDYKGCNWLATGVVTETLDTGFTILGRDGRTYWIGTTKAEIVSDEPSAPGSLVVGDVVRAFGTIAGPEAIQAARVRVMRTATAGAGASPPQAPEIRIVVEKPQADSLVRSPEAAPECLIQPPWENSGLVTEIDSTGGYVKIRTSTGEYTVNVTGAQLYDGAKRARLGRLSLGDSVRVTGYENGNRMIFAQQLTITMPRWQADSAIPQLPLSVAGMIQTVDYASFTFTMAVGGSVFQIMVDKDTVVQSEKRRAGFNELKPGMRVKMTGYGSPATGYAAQHIQIISVSP
jgi:hypothetical protein